MSATNKYKMAERNANPEYELTWDGKTVTVICQVSDRKESLMGIAFHIIRMFSNIIDDKGERLSKEHLLGACLSHIKLLEDMGDQVRTPSLIQQIIEGHIRTIIKEQL